jgi:hypothetical protein
MKFSGQPKGRRKCLNCKKYFAPHPRNQHRQKFCLNASCQKASKSKSQSHWCAKPENKNYWHGKENAERVRVWRRANPQYWKRKHRRKKLRYKI